MYNENVMKWSGGFLPEIYDEYEFIDEEDVVVYDDSTEWYNQYNNIDGSEAGVWVTNLGVVQW